MKPTLISSSLIHDRSPALPLGRALAAATFAALAFSMAACSGHHSVGTNGALADRFLLAPSFSSIYAQTLSTACIECHQPGASASADYGVELDFSSQAAAFSSLQGTVASATSRGQCGGVKIVRAGNPASSYLLAEIDQSFSSPDFGGVAGCVPAAVHYSTINLSQAQRSDIVSWIQAGAPNN